ncbi:ABC transporter permease, partial [bacterium]|nr:ABC transporter permease [bacterium]
MISEILHTLRQYKSRTAMTLFGIIWGTVTMIVLLAFGAGVQRSMRKNMHGMGESIAILWPGRTSVAYKGYGRDRSIRFREEDAEILRKQIPELSAISPEYSRWGTPVKVGEQVNRPNISGVLPEYADMRNIQTEPGGRWIDDLDIRDKKRVVFLGNKLKEYLFGNDKNAVGEYILINTSPFLVIGVLKKKIQPSSYNAQDQDRAFIPVSTHAAFFGDQYIENIVYQIRDPRQAKTVQAKIYEAFGKKFQFDPNDKQALGIWDTTEQDKFIFYFTLGFNIFMTIIGIFTLTVGGIGLANIMYVVVQERTHEIGIRRSVGARRSHILGQFILEAFIIIGMGAAVGFFFSFLLIKVISLMPIEDYVGHPVLSLQVAALSMAVLGLIGFLAGYFP